MMKVCIVTIALFACAAQDAVPALKFESTDGTTCLIRKDGSDIVGACGSDAFKSIISGDTSLLETRLTNLETSIRDHIPCRPGMHKNAHNPFDSSTDTHTAVCLPCAGDTYTDEFNFLSGCLNCPTGYGHDDSKLHTYCNLCTAGYGKNTFSFEQDSHEAQHRSCDVCDVNQFAKRSQMPCQSCPANTHTNGMNAQGECTMCAAGFGRSGFDSMGHATCAACVQGSTYSTAAMIGCDLLPTCAAGQGVVSGTVFSTTSVTNYCEDCSSNTEYSDQDSLSSCQTHSPCPAGEGVVNALNQVSDTSHRNCESCPSDKYSASSAFAQCYTFAAAKYTKTASATFPLACAANHYRVSANAIQYDSSTGAMSNDVCTSCGTCSSPIRTACGDTSPPVCCTTKPPLSAYTASAGAIDSTCAFTCTDPNAILSGSSCQCRTGWERSSDSSSCTETPLVTGTTGYFNGAGNTGSCSMGTEMNEQQCRDFAAAQGYNFHGTGSWGADYPNCQGDTSGSIWFNTHQSPQGTWGPSTYGQWCAHTSGYFNGAGNTGACTNGYEMNEQQCRDFAADMGYTFHGTGGWGADYPNCQGDTSGSIWFNTHQSPQGTWGPSTYGQWCGGNVGPPQPYFNGAGNTGACTNGDEMNEQQCRDFAADMGYTFHGTGSWGADYPNCQGDTSGSIWFNTHQSPQGTWGPSTYGQWCGGN